MNRSLTRPLGEQRSYAYIVLGLASVIWLISNIALEIDFSFLNIHDIYGEVIFNLMIVSLAAALTWPLFLERLRFRPLGAINVSITSFVLSSLVCWSLKSLNVTPGDLYKSLLYPLLLAPLIEEALFRYTLWMPIEKRFGGNSALLTTSLLFSLVHLKSYSVVSEEVRSFILAQGAYTFVFALAVGYINLRTRSLLNAVLAHIFANLGAFIAFYFV